MFLNYVYACRFLASQIYPSGTCKYMTFVLSHQWQQQQSSYYLYYTSKNIGGTIFGAKSPLICLFQ